MTRRFAFLFCIAFLLASSLPALAVSKEMVQLQTQVQQLQDQMARMQQSFDERMGVMKNLIEQSTDNVNKMANSVDTLQKSLTQQNGDTASKVDQVSGQVQSLHDSIDELKARMARVQKQLDDMNAAKTDLNTTGAAAQQQAPPAGDLYNNSLRDYNAAKYVLAQQEFGDYVKFYGTTDLAGNAFFYLGEIAYRNGDFPSAIANYDKVMEQFPGGNKAAPAQLKKGYALLESGQKQEGTKELQSLINRYPRSPEAAQARERLRKLGAANAAPRKPSASQR